MATSRMRYAVAVLSPYCKLFSRTPEQASRLSCHDSRGLPLRPSAPVIGLGKESTTTLDCVLRAPYLLRMLRRRQYRSAGPYR